MTAWGQNIYNAATPTLREMCGPLPASNGCLTTTTRASDLFVVKYFAPPSRSFLVLVVGLGLLPLFADAQNPPVISFSFENNSQPGGVQASAAIKLNGKVGYEPGIRGFAGAFDGSTSLELPDAPAFRPGKFSVSAWASPQQSACGGRILEKGASNSYWLLFSWGKARFGFWDPEKGYQEVQSSTAFKPNEWAFVVGTFDGTHLRIYVDGKLESMTRTEGKPNFSDQPLMVGAKFRGMAGDCFIGALDEVALYDRVLSESEILSAAQAR
jgi:hypothetical protein